jgi:hypothetical protein
MLISTALLLDSIIRNSVCTPAKLPCRRVEVGYEKGLGISPRQFSQLAKDTFLQIYFGVFIKCFVQVNGQSLTSKFCCAESSMQARY